MKVAKDLVVSLAYQVRTEDGVLVDESPASAPLDYLHGRGALISGLESALDGRVAGDVFDVDVGANDAYGQYDENLVQRVPKDVFVGVDELEVGMRFLADTDMGPVPVEITGIEGDEVIVDGNHMLAGQNLKFHVEVIGVREATAEELEHGHVHGEEGGCCGGHDHGEEGGCCGGGHDHGHEHGEGGCCGGGGHGKGHGHGNGGCGCH
ncbi:peptidylprolyl isomerase [Morganella morganii]|uniref:peptidylprolyl isomerase n=1 Tax=Morganella morganii TaxID=582 RepID=UPI001C46CF3F|nr:peptidylprolyl isomerase [Morganella morganii]QXO80824.1 peptidylprolyl isomerase [Morganella morganii]